MISRSVAFKSSLFLVLALSAFLFFFRLGDRSFRNPDEGRYAEIPRQMLTTGDWVVPRLYGVDYLRKPPFYYWLVAISLKCFGMNEWAARFVGTLAGILGVLGVYYFCRKVLDQQTAFYASTILACNVWYVQVGRYLLIDMFFSVVVVFGVFAWHLAVTASTHRIEKFILFYILASISFLTKGVAGPLIFTFSMIAHAVAHKNIKSVFSGKYLLLGVFIFAAIVAPWFWMMSRYEPDFLKFFFIHEHFSRFTSAQFEHQEPWYFYLLFIGGVFFPWSVVLFSSSKSKEDSAVIDISGRVVIERKRNIHLYLGLVAALIILFYSISKTKLATYIVPSIPLLSILAGAKVAAALKEDRPFLQRNNILIFSVILLIISTTLLIIPADIYFSYFLGKKYLLGQCIRFSAAFTWVIGLALFLFSKTLKQLFYAGIFSLSLVCVCGIFLMEKANTFYTTKEFAAVLKPMLKENDVICIYGHPGAFYDFAFYLNADVYPVGQDGEFEHMSAKDIARNKIVSFEKFDEWIKQRKLLYCLMRRSDFEGKSDILRGRVQIIHEDERKVLFQTLE